MKITLYKNYRKFCLQSKEYHKVSIPHATVWTFVLQICFKHLTINVYSWQTCDISQKQIYWKIKPVNISYSNFFHCLSLKSPLKLFYHSFHTLVSRECRDILSYARQIPNAKKENIKAVFTVFILLFHCYSKLLGRSKKNSFSKWYTC